MVRAGVAIRCASNRVFQARNSLNPNTGGNIHGRIPITFAESVNENSGPFGLEFFRMRTASPANRRRRVPSRRLTYNEAAVVWLRHWEGEIQSRIAASFDVNQGRISEILSGKAFPGAEETARRLRSAA